MGMGKILSIGLAIFVIAMACSRAEDPESIARSFVEHYYVHPDLSKAKTLTYGLARHKIEEEQRLVQMTDGAEGRGERNVSYSLLQTKEIGDRTFFVYNIDIAVDPLVIKKQATIATGQVEEGWRVTNFQESDI